MKALVRFSLGNQVFEEGDAVELELDEDALNDLKERGLISEGKGKKQQPPETAGEQMGIIEKVKKADTEDDDEKVKIHKPGTAKK